ncbi:MAG: glycoside hydrolase family 88 protein [Tannerellaceae bacterium]|nr:glycoside hydrolase family 88 protein [Tannerellaceae bacterium]
MFAGCHTRESEPLSAVIERGLQVATQQALSMAKELEHREGQFPKTISPDGTLETSYYDWWGSGFFPGTLWYLYEENPTPELKKYAELYTARVEPAKNLTNTHDLGFMLNCSFGNGYRITRNPQYKEVIITGAYSLATRYHPEVCAIRSWDFNREKWQFPVIIDNMMNLELLIRASEASGDTRFGDMANAHAKTTKENHFRPDYSSYHVVSYDTLTGSPHAKQTHQGFSDESAWARGQAWGLYGYTAMYRETGNAAYLELARQIGTFIMNHPDMPEDKIPYWDFNAPDMPAAKRDASAAAIMASAFVELSRLDHTPFGKECLVMAEQQVRSLSSPHYLAEAGSNHHFILKHSVGNLPGNSEIDVPLAYADYYYIEALLRLK